MDRFPEKHRQVLAAVFDPDQALWGGQLELYPHKNEVVQVLFMQNRTFMSAGVAVIREFVEWCYATQQAGCRFRVHPPGKVRAFLEARVQAAQDRWRADADRRSLVEECAVNSVRVAVTHLEAVARWQGFDLIKTDEIRILQELLIKDQTLARGKVRDYAASSRFVTKRLTPEERGGILESWWTGDAAAVAAKTSSGQEWAQVRGLLVCNLQRSIGRRGQDLRNIRLSMLFCHTLPNTRPVTSCPVIGASLRHVKECHENLEHLIGWARAKDREECPLGALAAYLVYRNDIAGSILAQIREGLTIEQTDWHELMLIVGKDAAAPISYTTHNLICHAGMTAGGVNDKTAVTHLDRNTVGCELLENGTGVEDTGLYQGWYHNTAADIYLRGCFKTEPMLVAHKWLGGRGEFDCWWECPDQTRIPAELLAAVFPGLDDLLVLASEQSSRDRSALEFLKALHLLRRIFLEDAIVHQPKYPDFPAYSRHPIFNRPSPAIKTAWLEFRAAEMSRVARAPGLAAAAARSEITEAVRAAIEDIQGISITNITKTTPDLTPPSTELKIPEIREPVDLYTCYQDWLERYRPYFEHVQRPPWKEQFGKTAHAQKIRYSHLKPFFEYVDDATTVANFSVRTVLDRLDAIRLKHGLTSGVFIKYCMYALKHGVADECKKPPPLLQPGIHLVSTELKYLPRLSTGPRSSGSPGLFSMRP